MRPIVSFRRFIGFDMQLLEDSAVSEGVSVQIRDEYEQAFLSTATKPLR